MPFVPSHYVDDHNNPTQEYGIWFDDGENYDWVFDADSLTCNQAAAVAQKLNAEQPDVKLADVDYDAVDAAVAKIQ